MKKTLKRLFTSFLAVIMIALAIPFGGTSAAENEAPEGYTEIYTVDDLDNIRNGLDGNYILMNDIDMTEATSTGGSYDNGYGWTPIGDSEDSAFAGILDGNGHTIKGMQIRNAVSQYAGLFGYVKYGEIKDLVISDFTISTSYSCNIVGAISGVFCGEMNNVILENIQIDSKSPRTGGAVGNCGNSFLISVRCKSGSITATNSNTATDDVYTGGICAKVSSSVLRNCANNIRVSGDEVYHNTHDNSYECSAGGLTGDSNNSTITACYNTADIYLTSRTYGHAGGLIGFIGLEVDVHDCYNTGNIVSISKVSTDYNTASPYGYGRPYCETYYKVYNCMNWGTYRNTDNPDDASQSPSYRCGEVFKNINTKYMSDPLYYSGLDFDKVWFIDTSTGIARPQLIDNPEWELFHEHQYAQTVVKPTCTTEGYTIYKCSCGDTYNDDFINALGHDFGEWEVTTPASCNKEGVETRYCSRCDEFETRNIEKTAHNYTAVTVPSTCEKDGYSTHTCKDCNDSYTDSFTEKTGHNFTDTVIEPTCIRNGFTIHFCKNCNYTFIDSNIDKLEHEYIDSVTPPTCKTKGFTTHICRFCGDTYVDSYTDELEHDYEDTVTPPTCQTKGYTTHICSRCNDTYIDSYADQLEHDYEDTVTPPTCQTKGFTTHICSRCNDTYIDSYTDQLEHDYEDTVTPPTCQTKGFTTHICSRCNDTYIDSYTDFSAHNFESGKCTVCGKDEIWEYTTESGTVTITAYKGSEKSLEIPAEIDECPVIAIAEGAFAGNSNLRYVSIPNSVFIIGKDAFKGCTSLKEVSISDSVSTISHGAFSDCTSLAIVFIASSNTTLKDAFSNNDSRLKFIVQESTATAANIAEEGLPFNTYTYPKEKDGKSAIAVKGTVTLYDDLDYNYWGKLVEKFPYAFYLYFDTLIFEGVEKDEIILTEGMNIDENSNTLTMNNVYISLNVDGKCITFRDLIELLEEDNLDVVITFDKADGTTKSFFEKVGDFFEDVFNALSKAINAIVRIFKKK